MIDLHCHLLPGIDDGPSHLDGSIELAREASARGVRTLAATPHLRHDHPRVVPAELAERADRMRDALGAAGIELEVVQGGEVALTWAATASDDDLRLVTYGGRGTDLLVETPYSRLPNTFEMSIDELIGRGFRLLLAHPENNESFQADPGRLAGLVARGVLVQITARSLLGGRRSRAAEAAKAFLGSGFVHVLASDSHSAGPFRPPQLAEGFETAAGLVGAARARWMTEDAPAAVLGGAPLSDPPAIEEPSGGLFGRLRARRGST